MTLTSCQGRTSTSSSAPVRRAACSPIGLPRNPRSPFCCSRRAAPTLTRTFARRPVSSRRFKILGSTGATRRSPGLALTEGRYSFRAARSSADRARSTAISTCGDRRGYDTWAQLGNRGWSYDEVLPYFRRSEDRSAGADAYHGAGGPLHVSDIHERHPICEAFIAGAESIGIRRNPDYNGASQEGVSYYQRTIRKGHRHSAAAAFLRPVMRRPNLHLETRAHGDRNWTARGDG